MRPARAAPRLGLVIGVTLLGLADLLICIANGQNIWRRYNPATGGFDMSRLDFSRLWYVGRRLTIDLAQTLHVVVLPPPAPAAVFPYDILSTASFPLQAWLYPPPVNLLAMLFSCIPLSIGYLVWNVASLIVATVLLRLARLSWPVVIMGVAGPVTVANMFEGQFGLVVGALLVSILLLADRRPRLAGALAGLLWLKPHLVLVLPAVVLRRRWAMITASLVSAGLLAGLSVLFEGPSMWAFFVTKSLPIARQIISGPILDDLADNTFSIFWCARSFGTPVPTAWFIQLIFTVAGFAATALAWAPRRADPRRRMAFTLCMSTLMTPYGYAFDLSGYVMAMAAMMAASAGLSRALFALLWLAPGLIMFSYYQTGHILFPFVALFACTLCHPFGRRAQPAG
jgi:hypothetical protein